MKGISATGNFVLTFTGREDELEEVSALLRLLMTSTVSKEITVQTGIGHRTSVSRVALS